MSCEEGESPKQIGESIRHVDVYRAARQFERFMMGINPGWRSGVDDLGDEHLSLEELMERRSREAELYLDPNSFGPVVAKINYYPNQRKVEITRADELESPSETNP